MNTFKSRCLALLIFIFGFSLIAENQIGTKKEIQTLSTTEAEIAYITSPDSRQLIPLDLNTGNSGKPIELEIDPKLIVISPHGETAYLLVENSKEIHKINLLGKEPIHPLITPITLENVPIDLVISKNGKTGFVICHESNEITSIELEDNALSTYLSLESFPSKIFINHTDESLLVSYEDSDMATKIDYASKKLTTEPLDSALKNLALNNESGPTYLSTNGKKAYITHTNSGLISKFDLENHEFKENQTIEIDQTIHKFALFPKKELVAQFDVVIADAGKPTEFDASKTIALKHANINYFWDFGDGESVNTESQKTSHTYTSKGTYHVKLVATESLESMIKDTLPLVSSYEKSIDIPSSDISKNKFTITLPLKFGVGRGGGTAPANATIASNINPSTFGQTIILSTNVSGTGPIPTGEVTFIDGATQIGTAILDGSGNASTSISTLSVGTHSITVSYEGDVFYGTAVSPILNQNVIQANSTTTVSSNLNPSTYGSLVQFTAQVTTGLPTNATGTVSFLDGATVIGSGTLNSSGVATFSIDSLTVGTHNITAQYNGDVNFLSSTSTVLNQVVNVANTTTTLSSSTNPSVFGQPVTFTAIVSGTIPTKPTGTVTFSDGSTVLGTGSLDSTGTATFTTTALSAATHSITASYGGDALFGTSTSDPLSQIVNQAVTTIAISSTPNPSFYGQSVTINATISISAPGAGTLTGTVNFFDGSTNLGSANVTGGTATFSSSALTAGTHTITAVYNGNSNFLSSTSAPWTQTVNKAVTSTAVSSSSNPAPFGSPVLFTATVTTTSGSGTGTGTVSFFDGATLIGTGNVSAGGQATFLTSSLTVGTHPITATYNGDANFASSTSTALSQLINKGATSTAVSSTSNPSTYGQSITLTGTVSVTTGAGTPTGSITFFDGSTSLGSATLTGTSATLSVFNLNIGTHPITAVYSGDNNFLTSTSSTLNQVVNQATPIIILTSSANPSNFGDMVTFTTTLSAPTTLGTPTGTVTFLDGATSLGTGTLTSSGPNTSTATFATANLFGGTHAITAVYSGDVNFKTVTSATLNQVVNQAVSTSTIIFSSSPNPTQFGQVVTLRATVTGSVANPPQAPLGSVVFKEGATTLGTVPLTAILANTSSATFDISTLATGSHSITATYVGDVNYPSSVSNAMTQNVIKTGSATVITTTVSPSVFGQTITINATVTNNVSGTGNPTGTVQFYDSATLLGSGTLTPSGPNSSVASFSTNSLSLGSHTLVGLFNGDTNFTSSTSTPITQIVNKAQTSVAVTSSLNPSTFGSNVTFTANVTATAPGSGTPTGTVSFYDGSTFLGTSNLSSGSGTFSTIALYPGTHPITAVYSGDTNFITSTSPALNQVVTNQLNTVTTITSGRNSSPTGQPVTFSARVTAITGTPTGTVTFSDGGVPFGTGTIVNGVATFTEPGTSLIALGLHTITARYNGDANFIASNATPFSQYVVPLNTTTLLTVSPNHSEQANATLTATVSIIGGVGPLTGNVTFYQNGILIPGTVTFNPVTGVATLQPNNLIFNNITITAIYSGDQTTFAQSFSNPVSLQVQQTDMLTTQTTLTSSLSSAYNCQNINLTATVVATQGFYTPTGVVTFLDNGIEIGSALLNVNGVAVLPISSLGIGSHSIQATYNSDSNYAFSISNTVPITVMTNTTTTSFTIIPILTNTPYAQNLIFAAKATALFSTPTGTMTFSTPAGTLAVVPLDSTGQATLQTTTLPIGTNVITATYNPTSCFTGSSANVTHTVDKANPVVVLSSTPSPSVYGNTVTIKGVLSSTTANVLPTGTVTFFNGTTNLGTVTVVQGEASINVTGLPAGFQILKANYSGDSNFTATSFPSIIQTVNKAPTTTALVSFSPNPGVYGELITYRATVSSTASMPTGTITFMNGSTTLGTATLIGASATLQTSNLNLGSNSITAVYNGDSNFLVSTSNTFTHTITQSTSITNITSITPSPSTFGGLVTINTTVSAINPGTGTPTGTVTGYLGSTVIGTATLTNGAASFTTTALPAGVNTIKVVYNGDTNYITSNGLSTQTVNQASTSTSLSSSGSPSVSGQPVTFSATVTSSQGTPTGTVSFFDGATTLATQSLNASGMASITLSNLSIGTHTLRAVYNGSTNLASSTSSNLSQVVNKAASTTTITSFNSPSVFGDNVIFQAQVTATSPATGIPAGTVTFFNGATTLGAVTLDSSGNATLSTASLPASSTPYSITASYSGSTIFNASTSTALNQIVNKSATQTRATYTQAPAALGAPVTFNITVAPINTSTGIPTGNVSILNGSTVVGSGTLNASGQVTIITSTLPAGTVGLVASYAGDSNFLTSSTALTQSITQVTPTITLNSSNNPSVVGQPVILTTTVNSTAGVPTGLVAFFDGSVSLGTASLNNGTTSITVPNLLLGSHSITAVYSGDTNNQGVTSTILVQQVNQATTVTNLTSIPNPTYYGETVTLYAAVNAVSPSVSIPTGTVTFKRGATDLGTIPLNGGTSLLTISTLPPGNNSITATYNGNTNFTVSTSAAITQVINQTPTSTAVILSPNPSALNSPVVANVTVSAINGFFIPSGTVTAYYGSTLLATGTLNGSGNVTLTLNNLPAGVLGIQFNYNGDLNNLPSSKTVSQSVIKNTSAVTLGSTPNPSFVGQNVTFTATVTSSSGTPTGTVLLLDGTTTIGTQSLNSNGVAVFQIANLAQGTHSITAVYNGDINNSSAVSTAVSQVVGTASASINLTSVLNPSPYGEAVALTATVSPPGANSGTPTGTVTFLDGATPLATIPLNSSGQVQFTTTALAIGAHSLTAVYNGDATFSSATSNTSSETIFKTSTVLNVLSSTPNPSSFGSPVSVNVSVTHINTSAGIPSGTVNAFYGSTLVGSGTLNGSGQATIAINNLPAGTLGIVLNYLGDVNFLSASTTLTQTVNATTSSTVLTSSANPSIYGQNVTFTATVTTSTGLPTGTVTFFDGSTNLGTSTVNGSGVATLATKNLGVGTHPIIAIYNGATNITASTSATLNQQVNISSTTTSLTALPNPATFGSTVSLTAVVTSPNGTPFGTVNFYDGATLLGTEILDNTGTARFVTPILPAGTHPLTAVFQSNTAFSTSTSSIVNEVINKATTVTTISSSNPNPSIFGEAVSFFANVSSTTNISRSGTISFYDGATLLGSADVLTGLAIFSTSSLAVGTHSITAVYNGDANFQTSTSTPPYFQTVNQINVTVTTVTTLTSSLNPSNYGDPVTFDVTITPIAGGGTPTGIVTLYSGADPLVTLTLVNGAASYTTSSLPAGISQIVALYSGDSNFSASTMTLAQVVNPIPTTTTISSSLNPSNFGELVTFTANVSATSGSMPTGSVTFFDGATPLQTFMLNPAGSTSYSTSSLTTGSHNIRAVYNPDINHTTSNNSLTQVVNVASSSTSIISASPNPSAIGETVTFIATTTTSQGLPTGTMTFFDGITPIGTTNLVGNIASIMTSSLSAGSHSITAVYNGDVNFAPSASTPVNQIVQGATPTTTTTISSSPNPAIVGQPVVFNIHVASLAGIPGGTVTLYDNSNSLVTLVLDSNGNATYTTSSLTLGTHPIQAIYNGSSSFATSSSTILNQVIEASGLPNAPTDLVGVQRENRYFNRTQIVNVLHWNPPISGPAVISYRIYRDAALTKLVAEIPANECLTFEDTLKKKSKTRTYYLVAVNATGISAPVSVKVNECERIRY